MKTDKTYYSLRPSSFKLDGGAMYGIIPRPLWSKVSPSDEFNRIELALRLLLIKDGERLIMIDSGVGSENGEKFNERFGVRGPESAIEQALNSIDLKPSDITDFVITHLHFDHVGGMGMNTDEGKLRPTFPNAVVHLHSSHYEYAQNPTQRDAGSFHKHNFNPIINWYIENDQINWLEGEEGLITQGLNFKSSNGHTPHMIHPYDDKFIYLADIIPTSNHINIPWVMGYDIAPGQSTVDKTNILNFVMEKNLKVIFEHDPLFWGSTITKDQRGRYTFGERFECQDNLSLKI